MNITDLSYERDLRKAMAMGYERPTTWDEICNSGPAPERERWPVVRSGERLPITSLMRIGVGRRDNFTCRKCHIDCPTFFELDHIIPWSAGGSDESDNLRVLCDKCNQDRSNLIDGTEDRKPLLVTWWCLECWSAGTYRGGKYDPTERTYTCLEVDEFATTRAYCAYCRCISVTNLFLGPGESKHRLPNVIETTLPADELQA